MIEISNLRIPLAKLDGTHECELRECRRASARKLGVREGRIRGIELRRRSIDARKRSAILLTMTVRVKVAGDETELVRSARGNVRIVSEKPYELPGRISSEGHDRPVVVGAGCAGLFCALALASAGLRPLLVERGDDADRRCAAVEKFNRTGVLDPESNIQFGLGGAGTFSDGKLTTGTKSPAHRLILETLAEAGAQGRILWDAKPHVGSDVLPGVVTAVARRIEELGGEVRFRTRMTGLEVRDGRVRAVTLADDAGTKRLETRDVVLACGHSARDVFLLAREAGVAMERKTFAMGVRIEHSQQAVDRALFGRNAGHPALGAGSYKLAEHVTKERSAFSFCMCPGGFVVAAASEPEGVVTNGMSLSDRAGTNANAGLLANVFPGDLPGDDVLAGIDLQRTCERKAFEQGGGDFAAPAQLVGDFLKATPSTTGGGIEPTYPRGVTWGEAAAALPSYVTDILRSAIPRMERRLHGFSASEAVLTGVETRSSSPVRMTRGDDMQSVSVHGLWPCGEGAGYAGGIMSAATDGLRTAEAIVAHYAR